LSGWGGISSLEMAAIDENAEWLGVSRSLLMENAGAWVARVTYQWLGGLSRKKIIVFCGTGNNGGDGFVAARHLAGLGAEVIVILIGDPGRIRTSEARRNFEVISSLRESIELHVVKTLNELDPLREKIGEAEAIIDAVFGTGIRGEIREPWRSAIQLINSAKALKISVDIPSGVNPDTGEVMDVAVNANVTVTFHRPKLGMPAAADYCGEVIIAPIGIPPEAELVMGPGNARQAFFWASEESLEIILLDDLDERAAKLLSMLGAKYSFGDEARGKVAYLGRRMEAISSCKEAQAVLTLGLGKLSPVTASIIDQKEAEQKLGIEPAARSIEKYDALTRKAAELEGAIYILGGESDILIGGSKWKLSWINRPLNEEAVAALIAITLYLMAKRISPFNALSAAGYLAGFAAQFGYASLIQELERLSGKG